VSSILNDLDGSAFIWQVLIIALLHVQRTDRGCVSLGLSVDNLVCENLRVPIDLRSERTPRTMRTVLVRLGMLVMFLCSARSNVFVLLPRSRHERSSPAGVQVSVFINGFFYILHRLDCNIGGERLAYIGASRDLPDRRSKNG